MWDCSLKNRWSGELNEQGHNRISTVIVTSDRSSESTLVDANSMAGLDRVANKTGEVKLAYSWGTETEIRKISMWARRKSQVNWLTTSPVNIWSGRLPRNDTEIKKGCSTLEEGLRHKGRYIQWMLWQTSWWLGDGWVKHHWQVIWLCHVTAGAKLHKSETCEAHRIILIKACPPAVS